MRSKILKILRELEKESGFYTTYIEFNEDYMCDYTLEDFFSLPNYRTLIEKLNQQYSEYTKSGLALSVNDHAVKAELRRMELDGLIVIGEQKGIQQAKSNGKNGPDFDNVDVKSESIIITTKGRSWWRYFHYKAIENPFNVIAIIISIISLIISLKK